jgi:hypothetical protein
VKYSETKRSSPISVVENGGTVSGKISHINVGSAYEAYTNCVCACTGHYRKDLLSTMNPWSSVGKRK